MASLNKTWGDPNNYELYFHESTLILVFSWRRKPHYDPVLFKVIQRAESVLELSWICGAMSTRINAQVMTKPQQALRSS
ncbi:predicted protein [Sclerotinia sclerotiorum 1980 UF-70]|uniref:Uncharacterized protein n=1 Tax=Sclerotinia sclerotiorum (strain ATCC 18683 / 1980 / Ss-1) TaxID=665079 RepID=A7EA28_SCLS1|nr:predicted protein [Sclerotinia sclerotiorum 1980 UF-70]EDN99306.1 predicted protein [Sclerotinia sclerotiorum 1980 UF-70]